MMNKERELLRRVKVLLKCSNMEPLQDQADIIIKEIQELIAETEKKPINFDLERMKLAVESPVSDVTVEGLIDKVKSNREHIVDVTDMVEPVAWITEWVQRYRHNDTPIIDRAVSFTKADAPAVPNPNYIPLYTAPPKREPLSDAEIAKLWGESYSGTTQMVRNFARAIEKAHGIGGGE